MAHLIYSMIASPLEGGGAIARLTAKGVADLDLVAEHISKTRNTRYSPETVKDVIAELRAAVLYYLAQGVRVNLGEFIELYPVYQRRFEQVTDQIENDKAGLQIRCRVSRLLKKDLDARVTLTPSDKPDAHQPLPTAYEDLAAGETNGRITPGTIGTLRGIHLKVHPAAPDEGVFFVARSTGQETRVAALSHNTPKQLTFLVPALVPGEVYRVAVRARPRDCKALRASALEYPLTCVAP